MVSALPKNCVVKKAFVFLYMDLKTHAKLAKDVRDIKRDVDTLDATLADGIQAAQSAIDLSEDAGVPLYDLLYNQESGSKLYNTLKDFERQHDKAYDHLEKAMDLLRECERMISRIK